MAIVSEDSSSHCYDIKSADLPLLALVLKSTNLSLLEHALKKQMDESPGFFDQDPVLIDVSSSAIDAQALDLKSLMQVLSVHALLAVAIKGAKGALLQQAKDLGLVDASDARIRRSVPLAETSAPLPLQAAQTSHAAQTLAAPSVFEALVINKPLRSGQQVYAKGRDLIVMAMVNAGAEVIADGHIHVYATLRGKAIAGARGNTQSQIFALVMEPELISIAGVYRTSENALPSDVLGQAAQVSLQSGPGGDKLLIKPLRS
jgi:septum site-determining protein MinC